MSPLWRNRLFIAISPECISLLKVGRGLRMKLLTRHDEAVAPIGRQQSWQAALDKLSQILGQLEWQNADVNIVLSNRLVRYANIMFSAQLQSNSAREAFARHVFTQTYGTAAEPWALRIQQGKASSPWLVSAIDHALLEGSRQTCATHKLKLCSITPFLMPVFNHYRETIKSDPAWLVINEPGYSLFALLSGKEIIAVNGVHHDSILELPILLERENLAAALTEPCKSVYLYTSSGNALSTMPKMGYEFSKLAMTAPVGFPSLADGLYAMAMSGVL